MLRFTSQVENLVEYHMRRFAFVAGIIILLLIAFIVLVGPWPTVVSERRAVNRPLERGLTKIEATRWPIAEGESLLAEWATVPLELPEGTPLAGYGARRGEPATGYHDRLEVGALVLGTGSATGEAVARVAIIASDLLVVTPRIADDVRSRVGIPILFTASHTHSGPGAAMPGLIGRAFGGAYRADVERAITDTMAAAVTAMLERAGQGLRPVRVSHGTVAVAQLIRNRAREQTAGYPPVDAMLDLISFEDDLGGRLSLVRFSAHPTIIGASNLEFSAGYPGFLRDAVVELAGGDAFFLPGAMGSMSPRAPEGSAGFERAREYARLLAEALPADPRVIEVGELGVADAAPRAPPLQLRVAPRLRVSPIFLRLNGIRREARITIVRLGPLVFAGFPGDLSGELGADLRARAAERGATLLPLSFSGAYLGYISPDAYYDELYDGSSLAYETGIMSWTGPGQERFFSSLAYAALPALGFAQEPRLDLHTFQAK